MSDWKDRYVISNFKWENVSFYLSISSRFLMAASWLRIHELSSSYVDVVCIVGKIQSNNSLQRTINLYDDGDDNSNSRISSTSSTLPISLVNLRTPINIQSSIFSSGQYVQVYGKVIRQAGDIIRIDAQFIRLLGNDFDINEYIKGLTLTRHYMANADNSNDENVL